MSQKRIKRRRPLSNREAELYSSVSAASHGLHGKPLGFSQFIRNLPDAVIQECAHKDTLLVMVAVHAKLIVAGDPKAGVQQEELNDEALRNIRQCVIFEHLRRGAFVRVRYPSNPFEQPPQSSWWKAHPFVKIIDALPEVHGERLKSHILTTGDTAILSGHLVALSPQEMTKFDEEMTALDTNLQEILAETEERYRDSQTLAWTADDMTGRE